jgi:hypothetical protein
LSHANGAIHSPGVIVAPSTCTRNENGVTTARGVAAASQVWPSAYLSHDGAHGLRREALLVQQQPVPPRALVAVVHLEQAEAHAVGADAAGGLERVHVADVVRQVALRDLHEDMTV